MTQHGESGGKILPPINWKGRNRRQSQVPQQSTNEPSVNASDIDPTETSPASQEPLWEYQWGDNLNALADRQVIPELPARLCQEIARSAASHEPATIFVRGELGIGKTTLRRLLIDGDLRRFSNEASADPYIANALLTAVVIEAEDLETPVDFAKQINNVEPYTCLVALARPGTLDTASQWLERQPTAVVTMSPFEPTRALFRPCLETVCASMRINRKAIIDLVAELASRLPPFMCTPFYFQRLAELCVVTRNPVDLKGMSPLEILEQSIELRLGGAAYEELVESALGSNTQAFTIPGLIDENGNFHHDGYRGVVLASLVLKRRLKVENLVKLPNSIAALRIILDHAEKTHHHGPRGEGLIADLESFVANENDISEIPYLVYIEGLIAFTLRKLRRSAAAETVRRRCSGLIDANELQPIDSSPNTATVSWDVSDALSLVGDERLLYSRNQRYSNDSGYFTYVPEQEVLVGSEYIPTRSDDAKPVLPYHRQPVSLGPLWVANFLVTNELYREFWDHPQRDACFEGTGQQWIQDDPTLMSAIKEQFDITARRCFWKEVRDQESASAAGLGAATPILTIARVRALRQGRVMLWDPTQSDDRFNKNGCPVVGITWWEAMAFCKWWERVKLPAARIPHVKRVSLLTDWEWEALRRVHYEPASQPDEPSYQPNRYPAHLRISQSVPNIDTGRANTILRPLHVGLYPLPYGPGPTDMVGNVWEWTRSRVYGQIIKTSAPQGVYGDTAWDDVDEESERQPKTPWRDAEYATSDLSYRAVRGASFFSVDDQAAWNPAYRLCDPPYSSYFDLGFRVALYP